MSAANVTFQTLGDEPATKGKEARFSFRCPMGNPCEGLLIAGRSVIKRNGENKNGGVAQWDWNGNREAPTFSPSINCRGCWHGYIREGRCVSVEGVDEPEAVK